MNQDEYDDVRRLWALTHAFLDFEQVEAICNNALIHSSNREDPIYRALLTAMYVTYGRPFKGNDPKMKLSEAFIPEEFRDLHQQIIIQRDKIYAHTDSKRFPLSDRFTIHRVTIAKRIGARHISTDTILSLPATVQKMKELAIVLREKSGNERVDCWPSTKIIFPLERFT